MWFTQDAFAIILKMLILKFLNLISLILMEIDYFKQYNDYYSHLTADVCLIIIS